jgi:penicillin amidase
MLRLTLADKLGDLTLRYAGQGPTPALSETTILGERAIDWLRKTLGEPDSHWLALSLRAPGVEAEPPDSRRDVALRLALRETVDILKAKFGPKMDDWAWGKLHTLTLRHALGGVRPLDQLLNRGPYPVGGDSSTVCAAGFGYRDLSGSQAVGEGGLVGAPFRFIADLGDLGRSLGALMPGQSGQPGSPHYDDQARAWLTGEYHPMLFDRASVEREMEAVLYCRPA